MSEVSTVGDRADATRASSETGLVPRLGQLLLREHLWLLAMLVFTALLALVWLSLWQHTSTEAVRINSMLSEAQQLYRDVYRQANEAILASQSAKDLPVTQYWEHAYDMDASFERLHQDLAGNEEVRALDEMRSAYAMMQTQINVLLYDRDKDPAQTVNSAVERWISGVFSDAFTVLNSALAQRQSQLARRIERLNRSAMLVFPIPLIIAIGLVLLAHRRLKQLFSEPMQDLSDGAKEIAQGHLDHRVLERGVAETRSLAASINQMAGDLAQARERLLEQERQASLGRLAPIVAHNIRNPLASIRALTEACDADDDPAEIADMRRSIIATVDRLGNWTGSLLAYLHPFTPKPSQLDLVALAAALIDLVRHLAQSRQVALAVDIPAGLTIAADRDLLEQALHGLLMNAIEASPRGSKVEVSAVRNSSGVEIYVDDEGPGIPFTPDVNQTGPGPTTKTHGTGIGIPFALRVCQAHGGMLHFAQSPAGGTRATLQLPDPSTAGQETSATT